MRVLFIRDQPLVASTNRPIRYRSFRYFGMRRSLVRVIAPGSRGHRDALKSMRSFSSTFFADRKLQLSAREATTPASGVTSTSIAGRVEYELFLPNWRSARSPSFKVVSWRACGVGSALRNERGGEVIGTLSRHPHRPFLDSITLYTPVRYSFDPTPAPHEYGTHLAPKVYVVYTTLRPGDDIAFGQEIARVFKDPPMPRIPEPGEISHPYVRVLVYVGVFFLCFTAARSLASGIPHK